MKKIIALVMAFGLVSVFAADAAKPASPAKVKTEKKVEKKVEKKEEKKEETKTEAKKM